jgi:uncharacterized protein HemY
VNTALQHAAALGADPVAVRYWTGRAKAAAGDPREAQRLLESVATQKIVSTAGSLPELYRTMGAAFRKSGQLDRAREALQAALQHEGDQAAAGAEPGAQAGAPPLHKGRRAGAEAEKRRNNSNRYAENC